MEKKNIIRIKEQNPNQKKNGEKKMKIPSYLQSNHHKPYKGPDGYLHCWSCRRRYEPGHICERPCK